MQEKKPTVGTVGVTKYKGENTVEELLKLLEFIPYSHFENLEIQRKHKNKNAKRKPAFLEGLKVTKTTTLRTTNFI